MGQSTPLSGAPKRPTTAGPLDVAFARLLLQGLACTASAPPRRQADLADALQAAGLSASGTAEIRSALWLLVAKGCVENLQPLADGGLLLTVTGLGLDGDDTDRRVFPSPADHSGTPTPQAAPETPD